MLEHINMPCCMINWFLVINAVIQVMPLHIIQRCFQEHFLYHVRKFPGWYMFSKHSLHLREDSFCHPSMSIAEAILPFLKFCCWLVSDIFLALQLVDLTLEFLLVWISGCWMLFFISVRIVIKLFSYMKFQFMLSFLYLKILN